MAETTNALKEEARHTLKLLRTLRDEIRVELRLASMQTRDRWRTLEKRIERVQAAGREWTEESLRAGRDLVEAARSFRTTLRDRKRAQKTKR